MKLQERPGATDPAVSDATLNVIRDMILQALDLTEAERAFLTLLFSSPAETVARERLIAALTDQPWSFDPHRIEVLVHRLRNRVQSATGCTLPVRAVRGAGYRLTV